jgi:Uma2 family endonuclease
MAVRAKKIWTYDDILRIPEPVDGKRYEVLDGELVVSPAPSLRHQEISACVLYALMREIRDQKRGVVYSAPLDVILSRTRVVIPDLVAVRGDRLHILQDRGVFGAPDLVIEILSPTRRNDDRVRKWRLYARAGIPEYWILDPRANELEQWVLAEHSYALDGVYLPGDRVHSVMFDVEFEVSELFGVQGD